MSHALAILKHALAMLIFEPITTLRVITPGLILILLSVVLASIVLPENQASFPSQWHQGYDDGVLRPVLMRILQIFVITLTYACGFGLMAVLWHRHVLMNGLDRATESHPRISVLLSYAKHAVLLGLLLFLIGIILMAMFGLFWGILNRVSSGLTVILVFAGSVIPSIIFTWIMLRLGLTLPAAAMGRPIKMGDSRALSKPLADALWIVALFLCIVNVAIGLSLASLVNASTLTGALVQNLLHVVQGLIMTSVLTTLYGQLIEGRELSQG